MSSVEQIRNEPGKLRQGRGGRAIGEPARKRGPLSPKTEVTPLTSLSLSAHPEQDNQDENEDSIQPAAD